MRIGIDLDNTLVLENSISKVAKEMGLSFTEKNHLHWDVFQSFPHEVAAKVAASWMDPQHMGTLPVLVGVPETLRRWKETLGHDLFLVTARDKSVEAATLDLVARNFPGLFEEVSVVGGGVDKVSYLLDKNIELWVDDCPHQTRKTLAAGIPTILVSNTFTRYNWHAQATPGLHSVVSSISEIDFGGLG